MKRRRQTEMITGTTNHRRNTSTNSANTTNRRGLFGMCTINANANPATMNGTDGG